MTAKNKETREAREPQRLSGAAYSTCLRLLREHGFEEAKARLAVRSFEEKRSR